jgi:hypothetical protein
MLDFIGAFDMKPSFKHDCEKCEFVGKIFRALDLEGTKKKATDVYRSCETYGSKYILRCSSYGPDYITTNDFVQYMA